MYHLQIIILFILGLCVGSFLNVLIDRLPRNKPIFLSRSYCDYCHRRLAWYDLIPILSFMILEGECRYCMKRISWQYPTVELITGMLFILVLTSINRLIDVTYLLPTLVYNLIIISGLIVIFFTDLKYRIIPDQILGILILNSLIFFILTNPQKLVIHLLSGSIFFLIFLGLVVVTSGKGMGLGDVKYAFYMGLQLGFPIIIIAFYLAFLTGALLSLILIITGRKTMKSTIAFGPFLAISTFISLFYGQELWFIFKKFMGI